MKLASVETRASLHYWTCCTIPDRILIDTCNLHSYNPSMSKHFALVLVFLLGCIFITISCTSNTNDKPLSIESQLANGAPIYAQTCATSTCHGTQGEGIRSSNGFKAWPLVGDEFQTRHPNAQAVFDVIRSGSESNLLALTDQQIYDAIAYQLGQNQFVHDTPLTAKNAFMTFGGNMSGKAQGGLYPPSDYVILVDLPPVRDLPIVSQNDRLRIQIDQIAEASAIGRTKPPEGGIFLIVVIALTDLDQSPVVVDPSYVRLSTLISGLLQPQPTDIHSAIEKFHAQTIRPQYGTVGLVVFTLPVLDGFDQLIYDDGVGDRLSLALKP